jgi:hypothetical protein
LATHHFTAQISAEDARVHHRNWVTKHPDRTTGGRFVAGARKLNHEDTKENSQKKKMLILSKCWMPWFSHSLGLLVKPFVPSRLGV